jgi:hypothetical protein
MIFRTTIVYTIVCALVLCPYPCLAKTVNSCCEATEEDRDCQDRDSCCPADPSDSGDNPQNNSDCCTQCGTCLCHGAILEHCSAPIHIDTDSITPLPVYALPILTESFIADFGFLKERAACHFHSAESGRKVRALIESFLI